MGCGGKLLGRLFGRSFQSFVEFFLFLAGLWVFKCCAFWVLWGPRVLLVVG